MTAAPKVDSQLLRNLANTVRALSIDGVQKANSGHPGLPLGCADLAVTLWYNFLKYDPSAPQWANRDRFVLSAGHGSMLLYSLLHLAGYGVSMDDLKAFRQWGSNTPGHPEIHVTPGVEFTTGPLGQGLSTAVGMALSGMMLRARFDAVSPKLADHFVYVLASDGDLMEGVASEACSLAGEWKLGNLICLYDDNDITLDGPTDWCFSREDRAKRFDSYGWHVQSVDGFDHQAIANAIAAAQADSRPSIIICKTVIGYGSPSKAGSSKAHGSPLGPDEVKKTKAQLGISDADFFVPDADRAAWAKKAAAGKAAHDAWRTEFEKAVLSHPKEMELWHQLERQELPANVAMPNYDSAKPIATRSAQSKALEAFAPLCPWLVGGSADLSGSTKAIVPNTTKVLAGKYEGRDLYYGVREHAMGAVVNGLSTQGFFRAFGATFLTFSDYMRGAIRLSALSEVPSIWVFTHDSIFLGEDGPTHQAVEHVAALRTIPGLIVLRPADAHETAWSWRIALEQKKHPVALVLSRQDLPVFDRAGGAYGAADGTAKGGYILRAESGGRGPQAILLASGSEVATAVEAAELLEKEHIATRVVSMPSMELFRAQPAAYRNAVLPPAVKLRVAIEAGVRMPWFEFVGAEGGFVTMDRFGASAPAEVLAEKFGFTGANVAKVAKGLFRDVLEG